MHERVTDRLAGVLRGFRSSPWLVTVAVGTLAAAIAMNVAMVGLVDRALLSPPRLVADPDSLFAAAFDHQAADGHVQRMSTTSYVTFRSLASDVVALKGAAAWQSAPSSVTIDGDQVRAETMLVSSGYFDLLGTAPAFGRGITGPDSQQRPVAVLSHSFWTSAFGADRGVLGRRIRVRGIDFEVAGIMPRGFGGHASAAVDLWLPISVAMSGSPGWDTEPRNIVSVLARIRAGASAVTAAGQATAALGSKVTMLPLTGGDVGAQERRIAYWLMGVSTLVLVMGLANAATLLAVRAARRHREFVVRDALGATRTRLICDIGVEAGVFALIATGVSLVLSFWLDESIRAVLLPGIIEQGSLTMRTAFAAAAAGLAAASVAAAVGISSLPRGFRTEDFRGSASVRRTRLQTTLLVLQTAVSVVLLAGAGMIGRSLWNLLEQDFGMRTADVLVVDFEQGPGNISGQDQMFTAALDRIRALPGVRTATVFQALPFFGFHVPPISIPGRAEAPSVDQQLPFLIAASPEFHEILGITISRGRRFTEADERGPLVVMVNETMAANVWPGENAIGKCIRIGFDPDFDPFTATGPPVPSAAVPCREVVGVAHDVRQRSIVPTGSEGALMQYYVPFSQVPGPPPGLPEGSHIHGLLVRTSGTVAGLSTAVRRLVAGGNGDLPYIRVRPYGDLFARQLRPWRVGTTLLVIFSVLAVGIASVGVYAAFAHAVLQRRREMAIRIAIGAAPAGVQRMVLREAGVLTFAGVAVGAGCAAAAGRALTSLLFAVPPVDAVVLGGAALLMLSVAMVATILPARTAARTPPGTLLRD
ncbi:MAG: ABC transporter permease [Vicinamibacterales bacterium]